MNIFTEYKEYLADNPKGYWFKRKLYGWGWTPARWQGWVTIAVFMAVIFGLVYLSSIGFASLTPENIIWPFIGATTIFLVIVFKTGESPKWQWGGKRKVQDEK